MAVKYPEAFTRLIHHLMQLPGIGPKSAIRLAFHILDMPMEDVVDLSVVLRQARERIKLCHYCANLTDQDVCSVCSNPSRDQHLICVVESPQDVQAIEGTHEYKGLYHVLHGVISPMEGVGPEALHIHELLERIREGHIQEVILATNPSVEGEATALFLSQLIKPLGPQVSRIAYGLPMGGNLDLADEMTISKALEGRQQM